MKNVISGIGLLILILSANVAFAEEITCESQYGECTMSETSLECICAGGIASSTVIGEGETLEVSEEACLAQLEEMCRSSTPVDSCESEYGACVIYEDYSSCECADGSNSGGGEGSEPGDEGEGSEGEEGSVDPDAETPPQSGKIVSPEESIACEELLGTECPDLPPDPAEECSEEALTVCNGMAQFTYDCWEDQIWPYEIVACCAEYETSSETMNSLWECFQGSSCETVGEDCYEGIEEANVGFIDESKAGGDDNGEDGAEGEGEIDIADGDSTDGDAEDDGSADDEEDSGCSQTSGALPLALLMLALAAIRKRSLTY